MTLDSAVVSSIGLGLDIVGVLLLWRFGLPEAVSRGGFGYIILEGHDEAEKAKAERYDLWAHLGLALLIFGFLLQLASNWI